MRKVKSEVWFPRDGVIGCAIFGAFYISDVGHDRTILEAITPTHYYSDEPCKYRSTDYRRSLLGLELRGSGIF